MLDARCSIFLLQFPIILFIVSLLITDCHLISENNINAIPNVAIDNPIIKINLSSIDRPVVGYLYLYGIYYFHHR